MKNSENIAKKYFDNDEEYLETKKFAFEVIRHAIKKDRLFIILRSKNEWYTAVPELKEHKKRGKVFEVKNYRQPYITPKNFTNESDFEILVEALRN
jgi:hypothetical protein